MDSDEATDFVDETLTTYNLETIENGLAKVHDWISNGCIQLQRYLS